MKHILRVRILTAVDLFGIWPACTIVVRCRGIDPTHNTLIAKVDVADGGADENHNRGGLFKLIKLDEVC